MHRFKIDAVCIAVMLSTWLIVNLDMDVSELSELHLCALMDEEPTPYSCNMSNV